MIGPLLLVGMTSGEAVIVVNKGARPQRVPISIATGPDLMQVKAPLPPVVHVLRARLVLELVFRFDLNIVHPLSTPRLLLTTVGRAVNHRGTPLSGRVVYALNQRGAVHWHGEVGIFTEEERELEDLLLLGVVDKTW